MASFVHRMLEWLGLAEEQEDEDEYEEVLVGAEPEAQDVEHQARAVGGAHAAVRSVGEPARSPVLRSLGPDDPPPPVVQRPGFRAVPPQKPQVHVVAPARFADAQEIGDKLRESQPVIVNLQLAERDLARRMIDFCSGVAYALAGSMEKVAENVFLLTPSNVEVPAEERARLSERGLADS